jgi:hypothetical protein
MVEKDLPPLPVASAITYEFPDGAYDSESMIAYGRACYEAALAAQPAASAEYSQFLTDVMTAAGLVSHGKQCKALGERLGAGAMKYMLRAAQQRRGDDA